MRPVVLVTGAARRLGRQLALHLARQGRDLALHHRSRQRGAGAIGAAIAAHERYNP